MSTANETVIGIDLGTTFSAMAYLDRHGTPITVPSAEGELITPSVVLFEADGTVVVGRQAHRACLVQPDRVAVCVKRDMGEKYYSHPIAGKRLSPQTISAFVLKKLRQDAERRLGPVAGAVITVPAYFDEARRQATVDAGTIAGLKVLDILNEPTAAALAYAFRGFVERGGKATDLSTMAVAATAPTTAMVYDLGGGTFDVTIIRISGNDVRVLATDGDVRLGGKDWDDRIVDHAAKQFLEQRGSDPRTDPQSHQDLMLMAEEAKKDLSRREFTRLTVTHAGQRLVLQLTRGQFEELTGDLLYRTESRVDRVVRNAKLTWNDISDILLVGGMTRAPQVPAMLRRISGKEPNGTLSADEVVAHGAAIHGAILQVGGGRQDETVEAIILEDDADESMEMLPKGAGVGSAKAAAAPAGGAKSPVAKKEDLAKALAMFDQDVGALLKGVSTVNVNAHSLGVVVNSPKTGKPINSVLIPRNTPLPVSREKTYGLIADDQRIVKVRVVEGESEDPEACITIGECVVSPLPPGLKRGAHVSVSFIYDNSGRLHVRAKEESSGLTAKSTIVRGSGMSKSEVKRAQGVVGQMATA